MEPEQLIRDVPVPFMLGNLHLALASLVTPAVNTLSPLLPRAVPFPGSLFIPSVSCFNILGTRMG